MSIEIISSLIPKASGNFPVADVKYIKGAFQPVSNVSELNSIPIERRTQGMTVYLQASGREYRLSSGITNADWEPQPLDYYLHRQTSLSTGWVINHNMGYFPNVLLKDPTNTTIIGDVRHSNANSLTVSFNLSVSGIAYLS